MATAKQAFKQAFRAVRVFGADATTLDPHRSIIGQRFDGNGLAILAISDGFRYQACMAANTEVGSFPVGPADWHSEISAAVECFAWRLWHAEHPAQTPQQKLDAKRRAELDFDSFYDYV